jgi:hypothetical protein
MRNDEREAIWAERLASYKASGQTKKAWCENNNIDIKSFYRWGRRLAERGYIESSGAGYRFVLAKEKVEHSNAGKIKINIGKAIISVDNGYDADVLKNVLRIMVEIC